MITRSRFLFGSLLILAVALTFLKVPLASSQGLLLVSGWVEGDLPVEDPGSALWQQTTAVEVPLSAQNVAKPFLLDPKIKSVTARVLQNSDQIAVLLEWADPTEDANSLAMQDFRDAAALQFPQVEGMPFFCMGQQGGNVNLWHWKADWQAEISARKEMEDQYQDMYVDYYPFAQAAEGKLAGAADYSDQNYLPALKAGNLLAATSLSSPVEDLIAGGFGTLTAQPLEGQNVQGFGAWVDGRWQVIFSRSLASSEADDVSFMTGKSYSVAFAVWDGSNGERNGQKSTSQWVNLELRSAVKAPPAQAAETAAPPLGFLTPRVVAYFLMGFLAFLLVMGTIIYVKLPE